MSVLSDLKQALGIGARTNRYRVIIDGVLGGPSGNVVNTLAKETTIPEVSFNDIEVWGQGKLVTVAGDISYSGTWRVTFYDDEKHTLRGKFLKWMIAIDNAFKNDSEASSHSDYMTTAKIQQLSTIDNSVKVTYEFQDIWPKHISGGTMSDDTPGLLEFTVEFNYSTWKRID